jgi:hypothetical protein
VITLFTIPKPFEREIETIQRNAISSWLALDGIEVVLVGDEPGTAEIARELGVAHVGGVLTSDAGTPRLDDAFAKVDEAATQPLRTFVNTDIVLLDDFVPAARRVAETDSPFLVVGATCDLDVGERLQLADPEVRSALRERALAKGRSRGATAIDYFVFTPRLFDPMPAFVVGRARFDNWLVWRARTRGIVVDATGAVVAVHQRHDYAHVAGGLDEAHFGAEAARNLELAGGKRRLYTINDASHRLTADGRLRRNLGAIGRVSENRRKIAWKLGRR